jgi:hypothetical protein
MEKRPSQKTFAEWTNTFELNNKARNWKGNKSGSKWGWFGIFFFHIFYIIYACGFNDQFGVYRLQKSNGKIAKMTILEVEHVAYLNF